jgi:hypothetical protein
MPDLEGADNQVFIVVSGSVRIAPEESNYV